VVNYGTVVIFQHDIPTFWITSKQLMMLTTVIKVFFSALVGIGISRAACGLKSPNCNERAVVDKKLSKASKRVTKWVVSKIPM
jgi:hypothetical protein